MLLKLGRLDLFGFLWIIMVVRRPVQHQSQVLFWLGLWDDWGLLHLSVGFLHRTSGWGSRHLNHHLKLKA